MGSGRPETGSGLFPIRYTLIYYFVLADIFSGGIMTVLIT
jgi:hypothetical protein